MTTYDDDTGKRAESTSSQHIGIFAREETKENAKFNSFVGANAQRFSPTFTIVQLSGCLLAKKSPHWLMLSRLYKNNYTSKQQMAERFDNTRKVLFWYGYN